MKKIGIIFMAIALSLTMSQCNKEKTDAPASESTKVSVTLNVYGGDGSRVAVNTQNGEVAFENGDLLYVASNGVFVGTMIYNGTVFSGDIIEPAEGQKLQFYFFGNVDPEDTLIEGTSTSCSVVISDQTTRLPVISYAPSNESYEVGRTTYNATLLNKCALVKFDVNTTSESATCIMGMNNKVSVDFATNGFAYSEENEGIIAFPAGSGERWAIMLPQDEKTDVGVVTEDGDYMGTIDMLPSIAANGYLSTGISLSLYSCDASDFYVFYGNVSSNLQDEWFLQIGTDNIEYAKPYENVTVDDLFSLAQNDEEREGYMASTQIPLQTKRHGTINCSYVHYLTRECNAIFILSRTTTEPTPVLNMMISTNVLDDVVWYDNSTTPITNEFTPQLEKNNLMVGDDRYRLRVLVAYGADFSGNTFGIKFTI